MADDSSHEVLVLCWQALVAVAGSIPKEMMPSYVRTLKEAVSTAKEKERRKRRPPPLRVAGFCLPKALQPILPIFLQGVLQVRLPTCQEHSQLSCFGLLPATALQKTLRPVFADPPTRASPGMAVQEYKTVVPVVGMLPAGDMDLGASRVLTSCLVWGLVLLHVYSWSSLLKQAVLTAAAGDVCVACLDAIYSVRSIASSAWGDMFTGSIWRAA